MATASDQNLLRPSGRGPVGPPTGPCAESRVWLMHPVPDLDVTDATRFGKVYYVSPTGGYLFGDQVDDLAIPGYMRREMQDCVNSFDPDNDFLLLVGDHAQLAILSAMLGAKHRKFLMLRYDRYGRCYFPIRVQV